MPKQLFVHGYLNLDDRKISKSLGNVLDPLDLIDVYGVDPVRFWAARVVPFGQDGNVTLDSFRERYERELGNDLGNLLSRTTAMIARYRDGELRQAPDDQGELAAAARTVHDDVPPRSTASTSPERSRRSGTTSAASTATSSRPSRGSSRRTEREADARPGCSTTSPTALRIAAVALSAVPAGDGGADPGGARPAGRRRLGAGRRTDGTAPVAGIEAAAPLFPRIDAPTAARA